MIKKKVKKPLNDLIIFGIYSAGGKCAFEQLIKECFSLFPDCFSFPENKKWPDSRKLDRPLRTLRKKKLITGDPRAFFSLTKIGRKKAEEIARIFKQGRLNLYE